MHQIKVSQWGNSLAIRIPKFAAEQMQLKAGDIMLVRYLRNMILFQAPSTYEQKFDDWLEKLNNGEATWDDMPQRTT